MQHQNITDIPDDVLPANNLWQDQLTCAGLNVTLTLNGPKIISVGHQEPQTEGERMAMLCELHDKVVGMGVHYDLYASYLIIGN